MLTVDHIIQLTQAGFTAEQITALAPLMGQAQPQNHTPEQASAPETTPTPAPETTPTQAPDPAPSAAEQALAQVLQQIEALKTTITASNIIKSQLPQVEPESAEFALASIILPPAAGGNK